MDVLTIEELRDYCMQLCKEGKGGDKVQIAGSAVGSTCSSDPYNNVFEWWDGTHVGYNGTLRILAADVYYDKTISKEAVREMTEDIDTAFHDLQEGDIASLRENIGTVQDRINTLLAEVY